MKLEKSQVPSWYVDLSSNWSTSRIEATQWYNGEGVTLEMSSDDDLGVRKMDLTWDEVEAIARIYADAKKEGQWDE